MKIYVGTSDEGIKEFKSWSEVSSYAMSKTGVHDVERFYKD